MPESQARFFSVKHTTNIGGIGRFIPSVCYRLTQDIKAAVEKMAASGDAKLYNGEVRFVTGVAYPVKPPASPQGKTPSASPVQATAEPEKAGKSGRAGTRKGSSGQRDFT